MEGEGMWVRGEERRIYGGRGDMEGEGGEGR